MRPVFVLAMRHMGGRRPAIQVQWKKLQNEEPQPLNYWLTFEQLNLSSRINDLKWFNKRCSIWPLKLFLECFIFLISFTKFEQLWWEVTRSDTSDKGSINFFVATNTCNLRKNLRWLLLGIALFNSFCTCHMVIPHSMTAAGSYLILIHWKFGVFTFVLLSVFSSIKFFHPTKLRTGIGLHNNFSFGLLS